MEFLRQSSQFTDEASGLRRCDRDPAETANQASIAQNCAFSLLGGLLETELSPNRYQHLMKIFDSALRTSVLGRMTQVNISRIPEYDGYTYTAL